MPNTSKAQDPPPPTGLWPDEREFIVELSKRAGKSLYSGDSASDDKSVKQPLKSASDGDEDKYVRFAAGFLQLPYLHPPALAKRHVKSQKSGVNPMPKEYWPDRNIVQFDPSDAIAKGQHEKILSDVRRFLHERRGKRHIHYLILPELAMSFGPKERKRLSSGFGELADEYKVCIVPGTYHCDTCHAGIADIYQPQAKPVHVYKLNPATKQEESIKTPDSRILNIVETAFGKLAVCICLDLYDPAVVLKLVHRCLEFQAGAQGADNVDSEEGTSIHRDRINIILAPSYNADERATVKKAAKTISSVMRSVVVVSNVFASTEPKLNQQYSEGFWCGDPMKCSTCRGKNGLIFDTYKIAQKEYWDRPLKRPQHSDEFKEFFGKGRVRKPLSP